MCIVDVLAMCIFGAFTIRCLLKKYEQVLFFLGVWHLCLAQACYLFFRLPWAPVLYAGVLVLRACGNRICILYCGCLLEPRVWNMCFWQAYFQKLQLWQLKPHFAEHVFWGHMAYVFPRFQWLETSTHFWGFNKRAPPPDFFATI